MKYKDANGKPVEYNDLVIWRTKGKSSNSLLVGYLYYDVVDGCDYIGDMNSGSGYVPNEVLPHSNKIKVEVDNG